MNAKHRAKAAKRITLIAAVIDGVIGFAKIVTGVLVSSAALIADGVHSLSDLLTDGFVYVATHYGSQHPDHDHPYGHGRIETLATLFLASILIVVAAAIALASIHRLVSATEIPPPGYWAMAVAAIALFAKEWLYHITMRVAKRINSKLLEANAWHSRTDVFSTAIVLIALVGSQFGYGWLDTLAAIIVGIMIGKIGISLLWDASKELVDTALPEKTQQKMRRTAAHVPGVLGVHDLRTRQAAGRTMVDVHIVVSPRISISEGHEIGNEASRRLRKQFPEITDLTFHIDPEDDAGLGDPSLQPGLPLRPEIETLLKIHWENLAIKPWILDFDIHYLSGQVNLVVHVNEHAPFDNKTILNSLQDAVRSIEWIASVEILKRIDMPLSKRYPDN
ncbi:cation transporter [Thiomicrospira aerophila AL3]|uniref:Cation transporter n=1 Tax=Thiomicrospira aerophila AL3 TaxID=717772 RepID=W0DTP5_9GAMM|nr:cation diffusion facilitator family transporter [Thiomicrospira aerophila]AHF01807.1 cation transporter [Thiomicrospira aerophila AL3]